MEFDLKKIIVGIIIVISLAIIIYYIVKILQPKTSIKINVVERGSDLTPEFTKMMIDMHSNFYNDVTSGVWKLVERKRIYYNVYMFLFKLSADKTIFDPDLSIELLEVNSSAEELISLRATLDKRMADMSDKNLYLSYSAISPYLYRLGTYSLTPNIDNYVADFSNVVKLTKFVLYKDYGFIHMVKVARSLDFERLFGNYSEYYMCIYLNSPYSICMVGSGEYK